MKNRIAAVSVFVICVAASAQNSVLGFITIITLYDAWSTVGRYGRHPLLRLRP